MNKTHAYIISGGDGGARRKKAEEIGRNIIEAINRRVAATTYSYVASEASISREQIAEVLHDLSMSAFGGDYRIIIIEDAQQMTPEAGNALLKLLEEPPDYVVFMLLVPTLARLMPTLRSRAQVLSIGVTPSVSDGSYEDALTEFFSHGVAARFAQIAQLSDRSEQLIFAQELLKTSQLRRSYTFAAWLQEKLIKTQKSGNMRLLLEASAFKLDRG